MDSSLYDLIAFGLVAFGLVAFVMLVKIGMLSRWAKIFLHTKFHQIPDMAEIQHNYCFGRGLLFTDFARLWRLIPENPRRKLFTNSSYGQTKAV